MFRWLWRQITATSSAQALHSQQIQEEVSQSNEDTVKESRDYLPYIRQCGRQGRAAEMYVSRILDEFRKRGCIVDHGLIAGQEFLGEHFGDIDFLVEHPKTGVFVVIEVKSSDPWIPTNDPRFRLRDKHHWQAARGALAVHRLSAGLRFPLPVVVYVDPAQKEDTVLRNLPVKVERKPESCYPKYPVRSVGAGKLRKLLWALLLDEEYSVAGSQMASVSGEKA